ncbi:MAG TPA: hypothetical protein VMH27_04705 [Puia sp.]|nr:hypothetical protein [Puia sp.]
MYTPSARRGTLILVVILLLISILLEQAIAGIFPWLSQLGGVRPMIVFLDIPLGTPVTIDWLPVGFIFITFYSVVNKGAIGRGWAVLGRWWLLLILMLAGGGIYYGLSGFLPKEIRKGIESFGMRADLTLPYPSGETVHLQGSMIMLVFFLLGWRLLINKALPPAVVQGAEEPVLTVADPVITVPPSPPPIPAEAALPSRGRIAMRVPDPVEARAPGGRPCVYVAMPAGFQRKRSSYPCVVDGGIRPETRRAAQMQ